MNLISFPFRLAPNGTVAIVAQGSDQANAELIGTLAITQPGERVFFPTYGLTDPVGSGIDPSELAAKVAQFGPGPDVTVQNVVITSPTEHGSIAQIVFQ